MALLIFLDESFTSGAALDPVDTFTGDGVTSTFVLVNKSVQRLGSTITVDGNQYYQYNGGFTKDIGTNSFTLAAIPPLGSTIVAPGINQITFPVFDQETVPGVTDPRVKEQPLWIGDSTDINNQYYINMPQYSGIQISMNDLVSSVGAQISWCQIACASPTDGTALTYGATGEAMYTSAIRAFGVVAASAVAGASSILCTTASTFQAGDYAILNIGNASQEIRKIASVSSASGGVINFTTGFDFSHYVNELIFTCGRKFWVKVTCPVDAAGDQAYNFYDVAPRRLGRIVSRV